MHLVSLRTRFLTIALAFGLLTFLAKADTLVVPKSNANSSGNAVICVPLNLDCDDTSQMRMQQVYPASEFSGLNGPITIMQIAFRLAQGQQGYSPTTIPNMKISVSTTAYGPGSLSSTFAVNTGADEVIVVNNAITTRSQGSTGGQLPPFDIVVPFQRPFVYDPAKGNLLLDFTVTTRVTGGKLDAVDVGGPVARVRVFDNAAAPIGDPSSKNIITQFTYSTATAVQLPTINSVTLPISNTPRLTPGAPMSISGSNLGTSTLDAAVVTIGGKPAPVLGFLSATSLLAQVPVDLAVGSTTVTATYKNQSSAPFSVTVDAFSPAIYNGAPSAFTDSSAIPITTSHPAVPGMTVSLLAIGLGATNPPMVTGVKATGPAPTKTPVQVMVANKMVLPDYAGLVVGSVTDYQVTFKVPADVPAGPEPVTISVGGVTSNSVTLQVAPPIPVINAIVNGATFRAKKAAPNSFVSLFGVNFGGQDTPSNVFPATTFNSVSVLVNGAPAPLYFVIGSVGQINIVLPSELPESGTTNVQVKNAQGTSSATQLQMGSADVGLFRIADPSNTQRNNGAVLFANTAWKVMPVSMAKAIGFPGCEGASPASNCGQPAKVGDVVQIYVTGLGKATPNGDASGQPLPTGSLAPTDGNPTYKTVETPTVTIGGISAQVNFSGIAPGNAGLYQLNVEIPVGVQPGDDVPIVVTMPGGSTDTVTIAIRPS